MVRGGKGMFLMLKIIRTDHFAHRLKPCESNSMYDV